MTDRPKYPVQTSYRVLEMIEAIRREENATLSNVAEHVDLSRSSVYNHLATLIDQGYVLKEDDEYRLSLRFLEIGCGIQQESAVYREARRELDQLAAEIEEQVNLVVRENRRGVVLYQTEPDRSINSGLRTGSSFPLHCTAAGKAILAFLNDETVEEVFEAEGLEQFTEYTITDREQLREDFERIREEHFAKSRAERVRGVNSVAVPILAATDEYEQYDYAADDHVIRGAIGVQLSNNKFRDEDLVERIWETMDRQKDEVAINLSYS